jgi:hypothetical protein
MDADPFAHFGEQQRSWELLQQHSERLAAAVRRMLRDQPELDVVGLIFDDDAAEAVAMRQSMEAQTGGDVRGPYVGLTDRDDALRLLRATAPERVEQLPDSHGALGRMLPLVVVTKGGVRFGAVPCE